MEARLKEQYEKEIRKALQKELGFASIMQVPRIKKIVVNVGVGEVIVNSNAITEVVEILTLITGQKPVITKAKKAVASFKIRRGMEIGVAVTLRGEKMWHFLDKLISVVYPRTKDFRGVSPKSFDGNGNYSTGIREHIAFPEIDPNKIQKVRSLQITIVTDSGSDSASKALLDKFGFPFTKDVNKS